MLTVFGSGTPPRSRLGRPLAPSSKSKRATPSLEAATGSPQSNEMVTIPTKERKVNASNHD